MGRCGGWSDVRGARWLGAADRAPRPRPLPSCPRRRAGGDRSSSRSSPPSTRWRTRPSGWAATACRSRTSRRPARSRTTSSSLPKQIDQLLDADLVLDLGRNFQPAVEKASERRDGPTVKLLDVLPVEDRREDRRRGRPGCARSARVARPGADGRASSPRCSGRSRSADPVRARDLPAQRRRSSAPSSPRSTPASATGLADCDRTLIVTAHEAFGYLARRYGLRQEGVAGLSPDAEPDPKRLADLADLVRARRRHRGLHRGARLTAHRRHAGRVKPACAPRCSTRSRGSPRRSSGRGATYTSVMDANLAKLRDALGCR